MAETNSILEGAAATSMHIAGNGPDAALIAACAAVETATAAFHAAGADLHIDDRAGEAAAQAIASRRDELLDQMVTMRAAGIAGLQAKAGTVALMLRTGGPSDGPLASLLLDLGAEVPAD